MTRVNKSSGNIPLQFENVAQPQCTHVYVTAAIKFVYTIKLYGCISEREREREKERKKDRKMKRDRETERHSEIQFVQKTL